MWEVVDSLRPTLTWSYSDASCPDAYRISLSTGPLFKDDLGGLTSDSSLAWSPPASLQPGKEYAWAVQPINERAVGPIAGLRYFFTGPSCASDSLNAPRLLQPEAGAVVTNTEFLELTWEYPDPCLPGGYGVNLSTSLDFKDSPLNGGTGNPSTRWVTGDVPIADCTRYYWRIVACTGSECGPYSDVRTFRVDGTGSCPPEGP